MSMHLMMMVVCGTWAVSVAIGAMAVRGAATAPAVVVASSASAQTQPWPTTRPVRIGDTFTNSIGMKFTYVPAGKFMMGSPQTEVPRRKDEGQHEVTITKAFLLGIYEVTYGQFAAFVKDTGYKTEYENDPDGGIGIDGGRKMIDRNPKFNWRNTGFAQTDDNPVVNVGYNDAVAMANWLCRKEGRKYRLPTEAEWEYACRAGTTTRYSSGDDEQALDKVGWHNRNLRNKLPTVGEKKANQWGLYDMHGNVCEWCNDWYGQYPSKSITDPTGPDKGTKRILRGGCRGFPAMACRSAMRWDVPAYFSFFDVGFRLLLELSE